jgi:hypothetical protein
MDTESRCLQKINCSIQSVILKGTNNCREWPRILRSLGVDPATPAPKLILMLNLEFSQHVEQKMQNHTVYIVITAKPCSTCFYTQPTYYLQTCPMPVLVAAN